MANVLEFYDCVGQGKQYPIKSGVAVASGDLVGLDSNGQVVLADKDTGPVYALGFAVFPDALDANSRTGVAALSVFCAIARKGVLNGFSSLTIGARQYLSGTAGGYTNTQPSTNGDILQVVGVAIAADTIDVNVQPMSALKFQTSGNSTAIFL